MPGRSRILVTGATGFVGAVLMPELVHEVGAEAVAAYVLPGEPIPASWARTGVRTFEGDISDAAAVSKAVEGHSHVIHMAGLISYWRGDLDRLRRVNRDGVQRVVDACLRHRVERLVHISSVGAVGFHKNGDLADETTTFNWPSNIYYMVTKYEGQQVVEAAVRESGLPAIILNPASIMGPGDHNPATPHNRLYRSICCGRLFGSFSGGLAIVDVRDLVALIRKALTGGRVGEKYLAVGANLRYPAVIKLISRACGRRAFPFKIPAPLVTAAGGGLELASRLTKKRPLLTAAYGRLSGWRAYYSNDKSRAEFGHTYLPAERTIADGWEYFQATFGGCR
jgi:dihydroflavonol-4-reductase